MPDSDATSDAEASASPSAAEQPAADEQPHGEVSIDLTKGQEGDLNKLRDAGADSDGPPSGTEVVEREREGIRSDLARGLLWLLTITIGGVIFFVGLGRIPGDVLTQSIFPSLVTLTGTAFGFYFGAQTAKKG